MKLIRSGGDLLLEWVETVGVCCIESYCFEAICFLAELHALDLIVSETHVAWTHWVPLMLRLLLRLLRHCPGEKSIIVGEEQPCSFRVDWVAALILLSKQLLLVRLLSHLLLLLAKNTVLRLLIQCRWMSVVVRLVIRLHVAAAAILSNKSICCAPDCLEHLLRRVLLRLRKRWLEIVLRMRRDVGVTWIRKVDEIVGCEHLVRWVDWRLLDRWCEILIVNVQLASWFFLDKWWLASRKVLVDEWFWWLKKKLCISIAACFHFAQKRCWSSAILGESRHTVALLRRLLLRFISPTDKFTIVLDLVHC